VTKTAYTIRAIQTIGYVRGSDGRLEKEPDKRVREALELVFHKYEELNSARQVLLWLLQRAIELPAMRYGPEGAKIMWAPPTYSRVHHILTNPVYAGAYVFGRTTTVVRLEDGRKRVRKAPVGQSQWRVCIPNQHEGYIDWRTFLRNQQRLAENANMRGEAVRGSIRRGEALLAGLLRCGHCGRKLAVAYTGDGGMYPRYYCRGAQVDRQNSCISFGGWRIEEAIAEELLKVITPLGVEAALLAIDLSNSEGDATCRQVDLALEQARFEAKHAQRRYEAVDPDNRLVAGELERRWNERLASVSRLQDDLTAARQHVLPPMNQVERTRFIALGDDLPKVWNHPNATAETRKRILRTALKEIVVRVDGEMLRCMLHWEGGDHTEVAVQKNKTGEHRWRTKVGTEELITVLARQMPDFSIASLLNRIGVRSSKGLTWNEPRLRSFRSDRNIAIYREGERAERGEVTLAEAAKLLGVSKMSMLRLIEQCIVPATQVCPRAPWVILRSDLEKPQVKQAVRRTGGVPEPGNQKQDSLKFQ
jgi:hypothetical protein